MPNADNLNRPASGTQHGTPRIGLSPAIQRELAALAQIDAHYQAQLERLDRWRRSPAWKEGHARRLEERHAKERQPHVLRLADLYQQMMATTMFRELSTLH